LQVKPQMPVQAAVAWATVVVHGLPHDPQSLTLLVVSTHMPLHSVGVGAEHPDTHVEPEQTGVEPVHRLPQLPQLVALRATQRLLQRIDPLAQPASGTPASSLAASSPETASPPPSLLASWPASSPESAPTGVASSTTASSPESDP
jgi:hypothetical protein